MSEEKTDKILRLLQDIRDGQALALERQARQLEISERMFAQAEEQYQRAARLTTKAEALQDRGLTAVKWLLVLATAAILLLIFI